MHCVRNISEDLVYVGSSDRRLKLFENIFPIRKGVSYNSYVLLDEKTVLFDTVDYAVGRQFFENLDYVLGNRKLDYIVVNHMEPDHCALLDGLILKYSDVKIVGNQKTFQMIKQFFDFDIESRAVVVKEGDTLDVGKHKLNFVMAPMVHWPEAMVTYESTEKILFSADGFGTFGALNGNIFNDEIDFDKDMLDEARRYYTNIVGKYGAQVQNLLKKAATLDIKTICPLHGPIWRSNIGYIIDKYSKWSSYQEEEKGVVIAYASMYGNTENIANILANLLSQKGVNKLSVFDVSNTDVSEIIGEIFKYSNVVIATPSYNGGIYPKMEGLVNDMLALNVQNKKIALIENGTWAPTTNKQIKAILEKMKNIQIYENSLSVKSSLKEELMDSLENLCNEIVNDIINQ